MRPALRAGRVWTNRHASVTEKFHFRHVDCPRDGSVAFHPQPSRPGSEAPGIRASYFTVKAPCMIVMCGSQSKVYLPFFSVTTQVNVPFPETDVVLFRPGPLRRKLWIVAGSLTTIVYLPGFSDFTDFPFSVSPILNAELPLT